MIPDSPEAVVYWALSGVIAFGVAVLMVLMPIGINRLIRVSDETKGEIRGLRTVIENERLDRIKTHGELTAAIAEHRAICDERHGKTGRRATDT